MKVMLRPLKELMREGWKIQQSEDASMLFIHWPGSGGSFCAVSTQMINTPHLVVDDPHHIPRAVVAVLNGALVEVPENAPAPEETPSNP